MKKEKHIILGLSLKCKKYRNKLYWDPIERKCGNLVKYGKKTLLRSRKLKWVGGSDVEMNSMCVGDCGQSCVAREEVIKRKKVSRIKGPLDVCAVIVK